MATELHSLAEFDRYVAEAQTLQECFVQSIDLTNRTDVLLELPVHRVTFLGCDLERLAETHLREAGANIFPRLADVPFNPYQATLYTPEDLYFGLSQGYSACTDAQIYRWFCDTSTPAELGKTLAMALHDHSMDDALAEVHAHVPPQQTVGVMGGHAVRRSDPAYRDAAELGLRLAQSDRLVITGGGPGSMEAANMGAWFQHQPELLSSAIACVSAEPDFAGHIDSWAARGFDARDLTANPGVTLGVPTWLYGHEPPNVFVTWAAKYFDNARREEALLQRCHGGIVFLPGRAGTVQEVFQAVTGNYYATRVEDVVPLVLVGEQYWTTTTPVWALLTSLAQERLMHPYVHLVDSIDDALAALNVTG